MFRFYQHKERIPEKGSKGASRGGDNWKDEDDNDDDDWSGGGRRRCYSASCLCARR